MNNIINSGDQYYVYGDGVKVSKELPVQSYVVKFSDMAGWWLEKAKNPESPTDKIYGDLEQKVEKVISTYKRGEKNLGVILSGAKGIGKSIYSKVIANEALKNGIPVILVNEYIKGIAGFLATIDQKCMLLFDEFDKNFYSCDGHCEDKTYVQDSFLTLFDGVYSSKKLFVITANNVNHLSEFLINRPGRFRYHIRFEYPDEENIRIFMKDKLGKKIGKSELDEIVHFSTIVPLSYDMLTAIADEIANGESFSSCLDMLNIVNIRGEHYYRGTLVTESGESYELGYIGERDFFQKSCDDIAISCHFENLGTTIGYISFKQGIVRTNGKFMNDGTIVVPYSKNLITIKGDKKNKKEFGKNFKPKELILRRNSCYGNISFKGLF